MPHTRRILYVWLSKLSTDRIVLLRARQSLRGEASACPFVTYRKRKGAMIVEAVALAVEDRLRPGMTLAEARALVPDIEVHPVDPRADERLVLTLARDMERYTPLVARDGVDGLVLDIAGCAHLFGGEVNLVRLLRERCRRFGVETVVGVADGLAVAWAVARHGHGSVVPEGASVSAIAHLPVAAMRLPDETVAVMRRLGLKTIADVLAQPRAPMTRRFGPLVGRRIDQLEGAVEEPISPLTPVSPYIFDRTFAEPIVHVEQLEAGLGQLVATLTRALRPRGMGTRKVHVRLFHADGMVRDITTGFSEPLDDPLRIERLLRSRLQDMSARIETESGVDLMRIHAGEVEPLVARQWQLDEANDVASALADLVDTLSERLGAAAIYRLEPVDTHQPALQTRRIPMRDALHRQPWKEGASFAVRRRDGLLRPLRLLHQPEPIQTVAGVPDGPPVRFRWRRISYHVALAEGPERIAPEWWREENAETCDYFRVEDREGRRFWLFRKGLYGRETATPQWFMHGFFG